MKRVFVRSRGTQRSIEYTYFIYFDRVDFLFSRCCENCNIWLVILLILISNRIDFLLGGRADGPHQFIVFDYLFTQLFHPNNSRSRISNCASDQTKFPFFCFALSPSRTPFPVTHSSKRRAPNTQNKANHILTSLLATSENMQAAHWIVFKSKTTTMVITCKTDTHKRHWFAVFSITIHVLVEYRAHVQMIRRKNELQFHSILQFHLHFCEFIVFCWVCAYAMLHRSASVATDVLTTSKCKEPWHCAFAVHFLCVSCDSFTFTFGIVAIGRV